MGSIEELAERFREIHRSIESDGALDVPLPLQVVEYVSRAREYATAARIVDADSPQLCLPILQLSGQAIELATKACWVAAGRDPPRGHDLIDYFSEVERTGFVAMDLYRATVVLLSHWYFADLATGTKYKARYPAKGSERVGGSIPTQEMVRSAVDALCAHAQFVNRDALLALGWPAADLPT